LSGSDPDKDADRGIKAGLVGYFFQVERGGPAGMLNGFPYQNLSWTRNSMNADSIADSPESTYVMGRTSEEYNRLRRQSQQLESTTNSALDRAGLGKCLEAESD
jgi:hypothetical protein